MYKSTKPLALLANNSKPDFCLVTTALQGRSRSGLRHLEVGVGRGVVRLPLLHGRPPARRPDLHPDCHGAARIGVLRVGGR